MVEKAIEKLSNDTFKNLLYVFLISCFWAVSLYLFKPSIFKEPYHIQFFILFAISFVWALFNSLILMLFESSFVMLLGKPTIDISKIRVEIYTCIIILVKSAFIAFGYYYSMYFTEYLRFCFKWSVALSLLPIILILYIRANKNNKEADKKI